MSFQHELEVLAGEAWFTQRDMAAWLGINYATVNNWFIGLHTPSPVRIRQVKSRLILLRKVLRHAKAGLPVPPSITQYERKDYVEGIRDRALKGIFKQGSSN